MHSLPLVDQYSHGVLHGELGLGAFERRLAAAVGESAPGEGAAAGSFFDSRVGLAVRRWCPPLLGLEPDCSAVSYLARRRELGAYTAGRTLLRASGIKVFLVDSGPAPDRSPPRRSPRRTNWPRRSAAGPTSWWASNGSRRVPPTPPAPSTRSWTRSPRR